ncbi:MAG: hypothetical protein HGA78_03465 [Nitrospirales bacterium]|nr:hypothetical protein [Nitrospirales bacterium]
MNIGYLHHVINHFPPTGIFFSLLILIAGMSLKNNTLKRTSLWAFFILSLLTIATYITGEIAEEVIAGIPGIPHHAIEAHEDFALWGLLSAVILGATSLAGLILYRRLGSLPPVFIASVLILSLFAWGMISRTAVLGARIRHAESVNDRATLTGDGSAYRTLPASPLTESPSRT